MMTAKEAREKFEANNPIFKHIEQEAEALIIDAINRHHDSVVYDLNSDSEQSYWSSSYSRKAQCETVVYVLEKYGYTASPYSDKKRVLISW